MARRIEITEVTLSTRGHGRTTETAGPGDEDAEAPERRRGRPAPAASLLLNRLSRVSQRYLADALEPLGIRPHEFGALSYLARFGPIPQGALGGGLRIDPSNLVALIDGLEGDGLVVRGRDPRDRRRHLLAITEAGAERLLDAERAVAEAEMALLEPLSGAERAQLVALLERMADRSCSHRGSCG